MTVWEMAGKKLHTGRSRNDQVALDMKLYIRDEVQETDTLIKEMLEAILGIMKNNLETYDAGIHTFTGKHSQSHWLATWARILRCSKGIMSV